MVSLLELVKEKENCSLNKTMELQEAQSFAEKILEVTHKLVIGPNKANSLFARIVEGVYRRDYLTLYTVLFLSKAKIEERAIFGNSCMDLCRRVLGDLICVEYIRLKGKDKLSKKFADFKAVEVKRDLDYLKASGINVDKQLEETANKEYENVRKQFEYKGKVRKSWAGLDTELMIQELLDKGIIKEEEKRTLVQTYLAGNYKNHFSPTDIFNFLYQDLFDYTNESDLIISLVVITSLVSRLATIFAEEFNVDPKTKKLIQEAWEKLLIAHLPKT